MSQECRDYAFGNTGLLRATKCVHVALGDIANKENDYLVYASVETLCGMIGFGDKTVRRALAELVSMGFIRQEYQGINRPSCYRFLMNRIPAVDMDEWAGDWVVTTTGQGWSQCPERVVTESERVVTTTAEQKEQKMNRKEQANNLAEIQKLKRKKNK